MENNTQKTGRLRRTLLRMLGPAVSKTVICRILRKKIDKGPAVLPVEAHRCSEILFILPACRIEMIFQLETLFAILGKYRGSNLTFICPNAHASFVSAIKGARVIKFDSSEFLIYGTEFNRLTGALATKTFDICVMLEREYTLAHLYLAGMSRAHLRVGWDNGSGTSPFLNIRLVSVPRAGVNLWERNLEIAKILDAAPTSRMRWGVPKSAEEEVSEILGDRKLKRDAALICVDLESLQSNCGKAWCAELLNALKTSMPGQCYIFGVSEEEGAGPGLENAPFPTLPSMSIPKTAALMARTAVVITGGGALLGLAQISSSQIVPVVTKEQAELYCRQSDAILPVIFKDEPAARDISAIRKNVEILLRKKD